MPGPSGIVDGQGRAIGSPHFQVTALATGFNLERQAGLQTHQATVAAADPVMAITLVIQQWMEQHEAAEVPFPEVFHISAVRVR